VGIDAKHICCHLRNESIGRRVTENSHQKLFSLAYLTWYAKTHCDFTQAIVHMVYVKINIVAPYFVLASADLRKEYSNR